MKLIVGLGNPGREYHWTRHNLGFLLLDELAREHQIPLGRRGLKSVYGRGRIGRAEVILAKPQTYMNLSGEAVQRLLHFFKIPPQDLVVLHDDLDLPWGKIRIRIGGSSGGHRGIVSIHEAIGERGISSVLKSGSAGRQAPGRDPADYVLDPLPEAEKEELKSHFEARRGGGRDAVVARAAGGDEPVSQGKKRDGFVKIHAKHDSHCQRRFMPFALAELSNPRSDFLRDLHAGILPLLLDALSRFPFRSGLFLLGLIPQPIHLR